mmetsp:Transcript_18700/g.16562  ORF Transcript_18700/g.16562 Transcript_18700/m.16562 type:complete len:102 (+) Transcript_18700:448-753(+)
MKQTVQPQQKMRSTFTSLGFQSQRNKPTAKSSTDRIFRRNNNVPIFDFTNQKIIQKDSAMNTQRDVYEEARPMAFHKPRVFSPMTKYRICQLKTPNLRNGE